MLYVLQVQAEEVSDITDRFDVTVVPYFVLLKVQTVLLFIKCTSHNFGERRQY